VESNLYWHCTTCGDHEPVTPTGDDVVYSVGDKEPCITCPTGFAHVMTLKQAARFEQLLALGNSTSQAMEATLGGI
jgi:hypothetical protein